MFNYLKRNNLMWGRKIIDPALFLMLIFGEKKNLELFDLVFIAFPLQFYFSHLSYQNGQATCQEAHSPEAAKCFCCEGQRCLNVQDPEVYGHSSRRFSSR